MMNPMTSNNSRLPIDLESDAVVEFAGKSGQAGRAYRTPRILIPTALPMRPAFAPYLYFCSPSGCWPSAFRHDGFRRSLGRDPPRRRPLLSVAVVVTGLTYAMRAWRWQSLLAPIGPTRFVNAFTTTVIGFAASALLPARAGEVLRPYLLARRERLNPASTFATIMLERLLDLATVLLLFAAFVFTVPPGVISGDPARSRG